MSRSSILRRDSGKDETGTITLAASHQGGHIVIEVSDDGRGLNREKILAKARTECEKMQSAARANLERAAQWIAEEVVNDKWQS